VDYRILGPLEIHANGRSVELGPAKERALLGVLLLHANEVVASDRLVEELWGERPPESAAKLVQVYVSRLRKALVRAGVAPVVQTSAPGYIAMVPADQLDAGRFERLAADARSRASDGDLEGALSAYDAALGLWRGPVLADVTLESLVRGEVDRLEESRLVAIAERTDCMLELGRHEQLVGELEALVAKHPLRERFRAQLLLALYRSGRQADALAAYQDARRLLVEELGIEPGQELRQLELAILRQDPALDLPQAPAPTAARTRRRGRLLALAAAAVVTAVAVGGVLAVRDSDNTSLVLEPRSIGALDPRTNRIVTEIPLGATPVLAAANGDAVWVAAREGTLTRVDAAKQKIVATLAPASEPSGLAAGLGSVWIGDASRDAVIRVDTEHNASSPIRLPRPAVRARILGPAGPAVAVGGGSLWVTSGQRAVRRIDPRTRKEIAVVSPRAGASPALAYGEGGLWVGGSSAVTRISPVTNRETSTIPLAGTPSALATGHGSVWVALRSADVVLRIDSETEAVETIPIEAPATALAVGHGAVWVAIGTQGEILRIDPARNAVEERVHVGAAPTSLAVSSARVWVGVS
jgi:DNA-binding SARP family transcriptional activator/streptogramin lyase